MGKYGYWETNSRHGWELDKRDNSKNVINENKCE